MILSADGWSDIPDACQLMLGVFDPPLRPNACSFSSEGHEDEEAVDESALFWVIEGDVNIFFPEACVCIPTLPTMRANTVTQVRRWCGSAWPFEH